MKLLLGFLLLAALLSARADTAPVTLTDSGPNVVLSNGIVSATISKTAAFISSYRFQGKEMASTIYYSMDGGKNYRTPRNCAFTVKTSTPDLVDIGLKRTWTNEPQAYDIDIHYVLRRGASGLYSYASLDHPAAYPATGCGEWRAVWKLPPDLLEKIYVDDLRHWQMPSSADYKAATVTGIKEITLLNTGPWAGKYDCKYDYSASYYDLGCWGHASDRHKVGAWIVLGGYDYFNDGPTKQDLNAASGINHLHFGMDHYNGTPFRVAAGESWQKIFGPFLLYCNAADTGDAAWANAKAQVQTEKAAWPYAWLTNNPLYPPAAARGSATGRFVIKDALKPALTGANAWIGLAQTAPGGNWQFDTQHYQYWTKTDATGSFTIPHVRPGTYTLYAFATGAVGEFSRPGIEIKPGLPAALGDLTWTVPHAGTKLAWEIGIPDRTAKEFRHGTDYFHGYVWQKFTSELSNPLEYTVGKSTPAKDWNFAQSQWAPPNAPAVPHPWRIHFDLPAAPATDAHLTLAIASADRARLDVAVNDTPRVATVTPSVQGGNALLREGIHAKYCVEYVTIPAASLKAGPNTITLTQTSARAPGNHVMYDYLALELP